MKSIPQKKTNTLIDTYIIFIAFFTILFIKALFSLFELFTYGILKKEILTDNSQLGFDIKIKM